MGGLFAPYSVTENIIAEALHKYLFTQYKFSECLHIAHWLCEGKLPYEKLEEIKDS